MIVKVCGMREAENIRAVEQTGADWMGFIFYPRSPRFVPAPPSYLPQSVRRVGVFVNAGEADIRERADAFRLDSIQLHGQELPSLCQQLWEAGLTVIKAFAPKQAKDFTATADYEDSADYFLFDTPTASFGGSGRSFDWSLLRHYTGRTPFLLSGGLCPDSLEALHQFRHPRWAGIDLNSGFEIAPGRKDAQLLQSFITKFKSHLKKHACL